jgi:hypothetical protein
MSETIVAPAKKWIELYVDIVSRDGAEFVQATPKQVEYAMIKFAQAHVQKATETIAEKAEAFVEYGHGDWMLSMSVERYGVEKESILNAYPIENVK